MPPLTSVGVVHMYYTYMYTDKIKIFLSFIYVERDDLLSNMCQAETLVEI